MNAAGRSLRIGEAPEVQTVRWFGKTADFT